MSDRIADRLRDSAGDKKKIDDEKWRREANAPSIEGARYERQKRRREEAAGTAIDDLLGEDVDEVSLAAADEGRTIEDEIKESRARRMTRAASIALIVACAYVGVLIFGVFMTEYSYDNTGSVSPTVLSVQDRRDKAAFDTIEAQYENCRLLYQDTLILDYRVSLGIENVMTIAPEYEALLDEVTNLSVKVDALDVETQYEQVRELLLEWIQDDIAVYLQNMAAALSQNDEETLGNAMVDAERVYNDFSIITQNLVAFGETLNGVDMTDVKEWSPEGYIDDYINKTSR